MGLTMQRDANTGIELDGLYYRIDKINFNDFDFQVVMTGYANQQAFKEGSLPIAQPRAYTWGYNKMDLPEVFEYAYSMIKRHDDFNIAEDVLENTDESSE